MRGAGIARYAAARRPSPSPFIPAVEYFLLLAAAFLVLTATLLVGVRLVSDRHAARRETQAVCAREIQLEMKRRPHLHNVVLAAEPCRTLARMRGE